jgi:hypothetical protein
VVSEDLLTVFHDLVLLLQSRDLLLQIAVGALELGIFRLCLEVRLVDCINLLRVLLEKLLNLFMLLLLALRHLTLECGHSVLKLQDEVLSFLDLTPVLLLLKTDSFFELPVRLLVVFFFVKSALVLDLKL